MSDDRTGARPRAAAGRYRMRSFTPWQGTRAAPKSSGAAVLVVDGDGVSRRYVEIALASEKGLGIPIAIEGAQDAARAIELLTTRLFDAVVSETELQDMSGLRLCQLLRQESRLSSMPFVFLSADARVETRVVALKSGVDDYCIKPCNPSELAARVVRLIARQRSSRATQNGRTYTLGGDFGTLPFPDLISVLELSRRTGLLSLATPRAVAELWLEEGRVIHSQFGNLTGARAFHTIMAEPSGQFEFTLKAVPAEVARNVTESVTELLMESARLLDEQRQDAGGAVDALKVEPATTRARPPSRTSIPAEAPGGTPRLGAQFGMALSDEHSIGELMLWAREDLSRWTQSDLGRDRVHVHLVASLTDGIASLLSLAGPPGERWVQSALADAEKALGLAFFLRQERLLDVLLIDIRSPGAFQAALHRQPVATIIAPANGDSLAIGPKAMVELEGLLAELAPAVLVWVGRDERPTTLEPALSSSRVLSMRGSLGDDGLDLRSLLLAAVKAWSGRASNNDPSTLSAVDEA